MPAFNFKPRKIVEYLEEGTYSGVVSKVDFNESGGYFSVEITLENEEVFIVPFHVSNIVFYNFAADFVDKDGYFESDDLINADVEFTVSDKTIGTQIRSKVTAISVVE